MNRGYRFFDIALSFLGILFFAPVFLFIYTACLFDTGHPIFLQRRVGKNMRPFFVIKFRTMKLNSPSVPTHMVDNKFVTRLGRFLRCTKLDELPQLWNVLKGEMSLVGPRPCLFSQEELIKEREKLGVFSVRPGITGLSQLRGIDMSNPRVLAKTDAEMIANMTISRYFSYIFLTVIGKGLGDKVLGE